MHEDRQVRDLSLRLWMLVGSPTSPFSHKQNISHRLLRRKSLSSVLFFVSSWILLVRSWIRGFPSCGIRSMQQWHRMLMRPSTEQHYIFRRQNFVLRPKLYSSITAETGTIYSFASNYKMDPCKSISKITSKLTLESRSPFLIAEAILTEDILLDTSNRASRALCRLRGRGPGCKVQYLCNLPGRSKKLEHFRPGIMIGLRGWRLDLTWLAPSLW